jgi:hypothetical protein
MATGASPIVDPSTELSARGKPYLGLFLIRFLILFFELTCIRWIGSMVIFPFFTNLVLMACFLGMSVGYLAARLPKDLVDRTIPLGELPVFWSTSYYIHTRVYKVYYLFGVRSAY